MSAKSKKSTRKINLQVSDPLTIFFDNLESTERSKVFSKLKNMYNVELKINAVGMLIIKCQKDESEQINDAFVKLNKMTKRLTLDTIENVIGMARKGPTSPVEDMEEPNYAVNNLTFRKKNGEFTNVIPKNQHQADFLEAIFTKQVAFGMGSPGTGKSFLAFAASLKQLFSKKIHKIVISKPAIEAGPSIGFLPGPQPLDAKVLTPDGWVTMGDLKVGSIITARDGKPTKVLKVYPKGKKEVYSIMTTEGATTECCLDHLWITRTAEDRKRGKSGTIKTTKEIMDTIEAHMPGKKLNQHNPRYGDIRPNHFLPRNEMIEFSKTNNILSPYVLGCILGDGSIGNSISISNTDKDLVKRVEKEIEESFPGYTLHNSGKDINYTIGNKNRFNNKTARCVVIKNNTTHMTKEYASIGVATEEAGLNKSTLAARCQKGLTIDGISYEFVDSGKRWTNAIKESLFRLGLSGASASTKFIPDQYKYTTKEDRIALLQGLMDTDGTVKESTGEASFCTTSPRLASDTVELVRSLGGRSVIRTRSRIGKTTLFRGRKIITKIPSYEFTVSLPDGINPFSIKRKALKFKSRSNFHDEGIVSIKSMGKKDVQCILVENEEHLYITDGYIVTHNSVDEKLSAYAASFMGIMTELVGQEIRDKLIESKQVQIENIGFLRGMTLGGREGVIYILDEAQNADFAQHKMILSRLGNHPESKIIYAGDQRQSDLKNKKDTLSQIYEIVKGSPYVGAVTFTKEDVVRSEVVKDLLGRIEDFEDGVADKKGAKK